MQFISESMENYLDRNIAAIDLGSSQIKVVIARINNSDDIEIIGVGTSPTGNGIKNGSITNLDTLVRTIHESIHLAELTAGVEVTEIIVNVSGKSVHSKNFKSVVAITNKERIVYEEDIQRVIDAAEPRLSSNEKILHIFPKDFSVDDQTNLKDPTGMTGVRLEADVHIVTTGITSLTNLERCFEDIGIPADNKLISSYASAEAVLTSGEKDLGIAIVDIGDGISDIIIYEEGGICYSGYIPLGGRNISQDISTGLKTPLPTAEDLKKKFGHCLIDEISPTQKIELPSIGGRPSQSIPRQNLVNIIEPRVREILEMVNTEIEKTEKKPILTGGIILTGGTSLLPGIELIAEEIFGLSVIVAKPNNISGLVEKVSSPEFSTAVGMIKYIALQEGRYEDNQELSKIGSSETWKKILGWVQKNL